MRASKGSHISWRESYDPTGLHQTKHGNYKAFGDAFVQKMGLTWIAVEDEIDRTPAIQDVGTATILFPLPMIQKRVLRGEPIDIRLMFSELCARIQECRAKWAN
jgi:hypothetical protein